MKDPRPESQKIEELFWAAFGRAPTSGRERQRRRQPHRGPRTADKKREEAYEDILWALVNAKEFQFND